MSVVKLQELEQVSLGVLERRDPHVADVLEVLHKLDARLPEPAALLRDVVRFETDDVAGGILRPAPASRFGSEGMPRRIPPPRDDGTPPPAGHPASPRIPVETARPVWG